MPLVCGTPRIIVCIIPLFFHFPDLLHSDLPAFAPSSSDPTFSSLRFQRRHTPIPQKASFLSQRALFSLHPDSLQLNRPSCSPSSFLAHEIVQLVPMDAPSHPGAAMPLLSLENIQVPVPSMLERFLHTLSLSFSIVISPPAYSSLCKHGQ